MDIVIEPAGLERLYSDRNSVKISTIAAFATLSIPSLIFHGNDLPLGVTTNGSIPEEKDRDCGELTESDDIVHKSAEEEITLLRSDSSRRLTEQTLDKTTLETSQHVQIAASGRKQDSPTLTQNVDGLSKSGIASNEPYIYSAVDSVEQNGFGSSQPDDACVIIKSRARVCCEEEEKDEIDAAASQLNSLGKFIPLALPTDAKDHNIRAEPVKVPVPFTQGNQCTLQQQLCNAENVPNVLDKPYDSDQSGVSWDFMQKYTFRLSQGIYRPTQELDNMNRRGDDGIWYVVDKPVETDLEGEYNNCEIGSEVEGFLPIPGDIMILDKIRPRFLESYLQPNPGGNTTIFVDRAYFERDQTAREEIEYKMQQFFSENDTIIRFGKFQPGWIWKPQRQIEFFIFRGKRVNGEGKWFMHGRLPNLRKMAPPDQRYPDVHVMCRKAPHYPAWGNFLPRDTDIIIRPSTDEMWQPFGDDLKNFDFVDADLVLRVSIMPSQDPWLVFTADLYMMETKVTKATARVAAPTVEFDWIFRGRDIQMFGPPQLDPKTGRDTVLDLNGIEPFVPRPIPHWGLHETAWGARPPPDHPP